MMRQYIVTVFLLVCTLPVLAQYKITGNVTDVNDGTTLYLTLVGKEHTNIDSTTINSGHFEFKGGHIEKPLWALIKVKGAFVAICDFYLEDGNITISGGRYGATATGTKTNEENNEYNSDINSMGNTIYSLHMNAVNDPDPARRDSFRVELKRTEQLRNEKEIDFIRRHPASPLSARIAGYMYTRLTSAETLDMLNLLSPELQRTNEMREIRERAEQLAKSETGTVAPLFTLPTDHGGNLSLSSYKGGYVLIDFWASWCAPCRGSFPTIARISQQYKGRLTVIGVSLDRNEQAWRKALKEEKCTWPQAWDKEGTVAKAYAVSAIPLLVLVGPDGKIVGRYQKGEAADELARILQ